MKMNRNTKAVFAVFCALVVFLSLTVTAYAADDPIAVVNNLSDFSAPVSGR
ncbi:MAG: hypothetical protein ACOYJC_03280 [Christensenellales bacterium]|jgi:hypothetical protein